MVFELTEEFNLLEHQTTDDEGKGDKLSEGWLQIYCYHFTATGLVPTHPIVTKRAIATTFFFVNQQLLNHISNNFNNSRELGVR